ncbi:diguanylate phosphodiesterase [Vibrio furnissii]|uniref:cyclic-guanylate-specific phosphodiesterase n=1 Tax=Vibrio furnissii TaxID=29494 RepID=A0A0Q2UUN6_VIBFU|nr:EAL domain-containing protein [Vibrio furnissii]KQH84272.1 diguanylate phosphodiesterase [Vibrio furnissii]
MLRRLSKQQIQWMKRALAIILLPLPIVISAAYRAGMESVDSNLMNMANSYVSRIEVIINELRNENEKALYNPRNCEKLQDDLLFESILREMLIVNDGTITCSSKRGELNRDISRYYPNGQIKSNVVLFDLEGDPAKRTLLVIDADAHDTTHGVISVVEKNYIAGRLGYHTDNRIKKLAFKLHDTTYPYNTSFNTVNRSVVAKSDRYSFLLMLEASDPYVTERLTFYLLGALPVSFAISVLITILLFFFGGRSSLVDDLRKGLERRELFMAYQPVVRSEPCEIKGFEALVRWVNPKLGFVGPDNFIPIAEEFGLINKLTDYVLDSVLRDWSKAKLIERHHMGVNIPPSYLLDPVCVEKLKQYAKAYKDINLQLIAEITERQLLDEQGQQVLHELRNSGILVAIDDFGTGRTALSVLQNIEFDFLKIDKCFVDTIGVESVNAPVLNAIIDLSHQLQVEIVAEGVETKVQSCYLKEKGVQYQQGYYYAKPLSFSDALLELDTCCLRHAPDECECVV